MGELSEQNRDLIERIRPGSPISFSKGALNDLLDAARTEGRGEGQIDAAYVSALVYRLWGQIYDQRPPGDPKDTLRQIIGLLGNPPIREPEISREAVELLRESLQVLENACEQLSRERSTRTYISMLDDGSTDTLIALDNARRGARDAILNLAPVGGRGEEGASRADLSPASRSQDQHSDGGEG